MARFKRGLVLALVAGAVSAAALGASAATHFSAWGSAALVDPVDAVGVNTPAQDGCPIEAPDGDSLYIASNRPGSAGLDLWVASRSSPNEAWGDPVNLNDAAGVDLNTSADEFCPTPVHGNGLF